MIEIVQLREITPQALAEFVALARELHEDGRIPTARDAERMMADANTILMAVRDDGRIVGMATLYIIQKLGKNSAYLEDVIVDSAYRGKGFGKRLITAVIKKAKERGVESISLTSRRERATAHKLYASLGFTKRDSNVFRFVISKE